MHRLMINARIQECKSIYVQLFQSSLEVISYVMHKMPIKCMLIDHIHISRLKFEYKISNAVYWINSNTMFFHAQDATRMRVNKPYSYIKIEVLI